MCSTNNVHGFINRAHGSVNYAHGSTNNAHGSINSIGDQTTKHGKFCIVGGTMRSIYGTMSIVGGTMSSIYGTMSIVGGTLCRYSDNPFVVSQALQEGLFKKLMVLIKLACRHKTRKRASQLLGLFNHYKQDESSEWNTRTIQWISSK